MEVIIGNKEIIVKGEEIGEECELCPDKKECDKSWLDEQGYLKKCIIPCG